MDPGTANPHVSPGCLQNYLQSRAHSRTPLLFMPAFGKNTKSFTSEAKRKWKQLGASALCLGESPTTFSWRNKDDGDGTDPFDSQKPNLTTATNIYVQKIRMCRAVTKITVSHRACFTELPSRLTPTRSRKHLCLPAAKTQQARGRNCTISFL